MTINNNTVLVTGAGSGIGFETAKLLKELGNNVIIAGRNAEKIRKAGLELGVTAIACDVTNTADIEALVDTIRRDHADLNILINNAGVAHLYKLGEGADAYRKAKEEFQVNYFAPVLLTEKLLPILKQQPAGAIVNITSNAAFHPLVVLPTYSDSKAALHSHTLALRHELAKDSAIKVFEVMPSLVNTDATRDMGGENGMHPRGVAESLVAGMKDETYEIYVGDTAQQWAAYLADPVHAMNDFNKGL